VKSGPETVTITLTLREFYDLHWATCVAAGVNRYKYAGWDEEQSWGGMADRMAILRDRLGDLDPRNTSDH
jgi:hypothetical protein